MQVRAPAIKTQRPAGPGVLGSAEAEAAKKTGIKKRIGRPAGAQGLHTVELRDAIREAFEKLGGAKFLIGLGHTKPETFCALLARTLPTQHTGVNGGPIEVVEVKSF